MFSESAPEIPLAVVLLIHLFLLGFPDLESHADAYDENLFSSQRPAAEKRKRMESIVFFLVGKIEGKPNAAKAILPGYPVIQPSDIPLFRNAATKYLESLRHSALHPLPQTSLSSLTWWSEAVPRKSLLEACTGSRFVKVILALSTHALRAELVRIEGVAFLEKEEALMKNYSLISQLDKLSYSYAAVLHESLSQQNKQLARFEALSQRAISQEAVRRRLASSQSTAEFKKEQPTTAYLARLCDAKLSDLAHEPWNTHGGRKALVEFTKIMGLKDSDHEVTDSATDLFVEATENPVASMAPTEDSNLPTAASRHPSLLATLESFPSPTSSKSLEKDLSALDHTPSHTHLSNALSSSIESARRTRQVLQQAVASVKAEVESRRMGVEHLRNQLNSDDAEIHAKRKLFWTPSLDVSLDFRPKTVEPAKKPTFALFPASTPLSHAERVLQISNAIRLPAPKSTVRRETASLNSRQQSNHQASLSKREIWSLQLLQSASGAF